MNMSFSPDFCFTCGLIGHDRACSVKLKNKEEGRWLKADMGAREGSSSRSRGSEYRPSFSRGGGSDFGGSRGNGSGSDSLSWRKTGSDEVGQQAEVRIRESYLKLLVH